MWVQSAPFGQSCVCGQFEGQFCVVFTLCRLATGLPPPAKAVAESNAMAMMEKKVFFI
jgi:hypothetical protein